MTEQQKHEWQQFDKSGTMPEPQFQQLIERVLEQFDAFDIIAGLFDLPSGAVFAMAQGTENVRTTTVQVDGKGVVQTTYSAGKMFVKLMPKEIAWACGKSLQQAAIADGFDPHKEMRTPDITVPIPTMDDLPALLRFRAGMLETAPTDAYAMLRAADALEAKT